MRLRLKWKDINVGTRTVEIYRTDTQPTPTPTGSPVATLTNGETQWDDTTVVRGQSYWYTLKVIKGSDSAWGVPRQLIALPNTGPGPQELAYGDLDLGVYGPLNAIDFITSAKLAGAFGLPTPGTAYDTGWTKFSRNGKTLFVPRVAQAISVAWLTLYDKGLIFGVAGPGPQNGGRPDKDQLATITIAGSDFIVRLPTGFDDRNNPTRVVPADVVTTPNNAGLYRKYSEMADLIMGPITLFPDFKRLPCGTPATYQVGQSGLNAGFSGYRTMIQEINPAGVNQPRTNGVTTEATMSTSIFFGLGAGAGSDGWLPVLELVDSVEYVL